MPMSDKSLKGEKFFTLPLILHAISVPTPGSQPPASLVLP